MYLSITDIVKFSWIISKIRYRNAKISLSGCSIHHKRNKLLLKYIFLHKFHLFDMVYVIFAACSLITSCAPRKPWLNSDVRSTFCSFSIDNGCEYFYNKCEWSAIRISALLPNKEVYYRNKYHSYWYSFLVQGITNFQNNILEIYATNLISKLYNASILFSQYFLPISLSCLKDFLTCLFTFSSLRLDYPLSMYVSTQKCIFLD